MRILITAGGTSEKIDDVRAITNHSTGQLGCLIAEAFLTQEITVDYVTTAQALQPAAQEELTIYTIDDTHSLAEMLDSLLQQHTYDAVIHSMAVSDFSPVQSLSQEQFLDKINQLIVRQQPVTKEDLQLFSESTQAKETKISSNTDQLYLVLNKTPKVIQQIKQRQPETMLIGFKLLVDVPKEELISVAYQSLQKNQATYVLANDLTSIHNGQHHGYLVNQNGEVEAEATSKGQIAQLIVKAVTKHV
ncbi:phosphopantothenate--cysteine ligase [Enterococcus saccharolyticus]|uniref:Phosphopantothenate--cysteine ligase n=1 Tax=Candidatus Enterococcus willemsii TaxID=1857215 RepID=A0ABQ6YX57_9ENTE|nr:MULTISPECIES: phosphopantothenate--cysteine ligase [Enterococcus]KAF1302391.1 phosphopantothenate--cysteine ligase [Enterococcus sp. CU12B]MCD5002572.1 phosphopantothenate--cysteine ligase [Enterococcus saccharolyticus]